MRLGLKLIVMCVLLMTRSSFLLAQSMIWLSQDVRDNLGSDFQYNANYCSEWLNQCSFKVPDTLAQKLIHDNQASPILTYHLTKYQANKSNQISFALDQIEGQLLIERGLTGKGVKIGIIDGGFLNANKKESLQSHFAEGRVAFYKDYITPGMTPYTGSRGLDDDHGTDVWNLIGGSSTSSDIIYGLATDATYYLARTDHGGYERRIEENKLIEALEEFHRLGIRLVNISLGYADGYTDKSENYLPKMMNGKTTMLAQAVDTAFYKKNMLVIVSAGNEGARPKWNALSTPADAKGALSVGASQLAHWNKVRYSSYGTPGIGYIKPEVICFATHGTSFSTPVITGLAAAIYQFDSTFTANQVKDIIIRSASNYPYGNNYTGYGVPLGSRVLALLDGKVPAPQTIEVQAKRRHEIQINKGEKTPYTILSKNVSGEVIDHLSSNSNRKQIAIKNKSGAVQTTVIIGKKYYEIFWK